MQIITKTAQRSFSPVIILSIFIAHFALGDITNKQGVTYTSLVRVLANPQNYHGKKIEVCGYRTREFEEEGLYLSKDDAKYHNRQSAIALGEFSQKPIKIETTRKGFVRVIGIFSENAKGRGGLFTGQINEIELLVGPS